MAVQPLTLPFVQGANGSAQQIAIIRKAPLGEVATSATGSSREYNKANIRILLASTQADLHPDRPGLLPEDIDLTAGGCTASPQWPGGRGKGTWEAQHLGPPSCHGRYGNGRGVGQRTSDRISVPWRRTHGPLVDGWLRVEYKNAAGAWIGVTTEWLQLGFARGLLSPTKPVEGEQAQTRASQCHPNFPATG